MDTRYFLTFSAFGNGDLMNGLDDNEFYKDVADFNGDGEVNIRDATAIQKRLAHIE